MANLLQSYSVAPRVLTFRRAVLDDFLRHRDFLVRGYVWDAELRRNLPEIWRTIFDEGSMIASVTEDVGQPKDPIVMTLGASVIVTDEFYDAMMTYEGPCIASTVAKWVMEGKRPYVPRAEIPEKLAGDGVNVAVIHNLYFGPEDFFEIDREIWETQVASYFALHRGLKFKTYIQDCHSIGVYQWMISSGVQLRTAYPDYREEGYPLLPAPDHPFLMGLNREESEEAIGSRAAPMFAYYPPLLGLRPIHRELLEPALAGRTDEELAAILCISLSAVKKRWTALYDHLSAAAPDLMNLRYFDTNGARGSEKRRHLLNYLRAHPEEMNPHAALS